ncbi:hypothetical protein NL676_002897 [Syzygium grande]|nr:hypothetical protein NL676_002897 [Syzygium grande]
MVSWSSSPSPHRCSDVELRPKAMGLASAIQSCARSPRLFSPSPRGTSRPPPSPSPSPSPSLRLSPRSARARVPSLIADNRTRPGHGHCAPVSCSRKTEQEDDLSTSGDGKKSKLYNDINDVDRRRLPKKRDQEKENYVSSIRTVALCVSTAVAFGVGLGLKDGVGKASEFFAGYILEQSLSVDNLFVFVLVFQYFKVPIMYQNRVLSYGIAGAIIFRLTLIILGSATLQRFEGVNLLLAAVLLYSSFKLFTSEEDDSDLSDNFIVKTCQKFIPVTSSYDGDRFITNQNGLWKHLQLTQYRAVFGVTRDPIIVFTSNLFAILGLRSLYRLISEGMSDLEYLQPSIAVVLGFIGCKMILDYFGFHVSTEASLGVMPFKHTAASGFCAVPSLEHDNKVMGESLDLMKYIDSNFEGPSLYPTDPVKRDYGEELWSYSLEFTEMMYSALKGETVKVLGPPLDHLDRALQKFDDGPFFLGQFSLVDIAFIPFVERIQLLLSDVWKYDIMLGRPNLASWIEEMNKIDAYVQTKYDPQDITAYIKARASWYRSF